MNVADGLWMPLGKGLGEGSVPHLLHDYAAE
jgi:hypothetical protein